MPGVSGIQVKLRSLPFMPRQPAGTLKLKPNRENRIMITYQVTASAAMNAPAEQVYNIIADYRNGHPHLLPKQFSNLLVEEGGYGAGTRIRFQMTAFGQTR